MLPKDPQPHVVGIGTPHSSSRSRNRAVSFGRLRESHGQELLIRHPGGGGAGHTPRCSATDLRLIKGTRDMQLIA